ncbi:hypothetical protein CRU92_00910 [Arcobacter sp. FW59]|nr:hypothetical protein CRU92_00910 [Arcobacter sp. FW59]
MEVNIKNMSLSERINEAFKIKKIKQVDLVNKYEYLSSPLVNKFFNSQKTVTKILIKLCTDENINIDWLCTGRGNMFIDENSKTSNINVNNSNTISNKDGNVAVNGTININKDEYSNIEDITELLNLLKEVPKSVIPKLNKKLRASLKTFDEIF